MIPLDSNASQQPVPADPPPSQWIVDYVSAGGFAGRSWYTKEEDARRKVDDLVAMQRPVRLYRMTPQLIASDGAYVP